jgi:hypothetical protein
VDADVEGILNDCRTEFEGRAETASCPGDPKAQQQHGKVEQACIHSSFLKPASSSAQINKSF